MLNIFVMGHSHLEAIEAAFQKMEKDATASPFDLKFVLLNEPKFQPILVAEPQKPVAFNPEIAAKLLDGPYDLHVSLVGGNEHLVLGLLNHRTRFDFVLPENPTIDLDENCTILPAGVVIAELSLLIADHIAVLTAFRRLVHGPLVHIESPPPIPSEPHIRRYPGVFADIIDERGVSPAVFRYKLWRLHSSLYRQACDNLGVHFLSVPEEMQDEQGMLIETAWDRDPTHGNALFRSEEHTSE